MGKVFGPRPVALLELEAVSAFVICHAHPPLSGSSNFGVELFVEECPVGAAGVEQ